MCYTDVRATPHGMSSVSLGPTEKKLLASALRRSRGPHYDHRIGLPFRDLARSFFPRAGEAESAIERFRGKGLLEYTTPEGEHARLTPRGRIVAGVALAGSTTAELRDRLLGTRRIVTTRARVKLCGLSFLLCYVILLPATLLMHVALPLAWPLFLLLMIVPPLLARQILQQSHPAVARLSPAWLVGGAILGYLCGVGLEVVAPLVTQRFGAFAVHSGCAVAGIFLGSLRET